MSILIFFASFIGLLYILVRFEKNFFKVLIPGLAAVSIIMYMAANPNSAWRPEELLSAAGRGVLALLLGSLGLGVFTWGAVKAVELNSNWSAPTSPGWKRALGTIAIFMFPGGILIGVALLMFFFE